MKNKKKFIQLSLIGLLCTAMISCKENDIASSTDVSNPAEVEWTTKSASIVTAEISDRIINIENFDQTARVNAALLSKTSITVDAVFAKNNILIKGQNSTKTSLVVLDKFKFGENEQKETRRPQGVANYGKYVITSWYFTDKSDGYAKNCKLTVTDVNKGSYFNIVPVTFHDTQTTKFKHIDSHAGGLTVIGHYLYMADGDAILIFDLDKIYPIVNKPDQTIATDQNFIYEYSYMIPQVGKIDFKTTSGAKAAYLSLTEINSQKYFVVGNFYSEVKDTYNKGGKSMVWLLPVQENVYPFASIKVNKQTNEYTCIIPLFPSGFEKNKTVTRIQGALIMDNVLLLNRSWSVETYQLIVMKYSDILVASSANLESYFSGTKGNKLSYDNKNWLYGCEDLEYYNGRVWTATEFDARCIYSAAYSDIIKLLALAK